MAMYTPGFWWGAPRATEPERDASWPVDAPMPLGPLADIHHIIEPKDDPALFYPLMHSFTVVAAYAPYLVYSVATGGLRAPTAEFPFGFEDPVGSLTILTYIATLVSLLAASGAVVAAYHIGRILFDRSAGVVAAAITLSIFPMYFYARTGNVDALLLFFSAVGLALLALCLRDGFTLGRTVLLGLAVGAAVATKESTFALFLAGPVAFLVTWRSPDPTNSRWSLASGWWKPAVAGTLATVLAFAVGSGLFVDPDRYFAHVEFTRERVAELEAGEVIFVQAFPMTFEGTLGLIALVASYIADILTWPGFCAAVASCVYVLWRRDRTSLFALTAVGYLVVLFASVRAPQIRHILPAGWVLGILLAAGVSRCLRHSRGLVRGAAAAFLAVVVGWGVLRGVDLTYTMIYDSRYQATAWLDARTGAGSRIEVFGPSANLPHLKAGVITTRAQPFRGLRPGYEPPPEVAELFLSAWQADPPAYILIMPDYTSAPGMQFSGTCPRVLCDALLAGELPYREVAFFQARRPLPWVRKIPVNLPRRDPTQIVNPPIRIFEPLGG